MVSFSGSLFVRVAVLEIRTRGVNQPKGVARLKRFHNLRWFAALCLCLCLFTSSVSAHLQEGGSSVNQMESWDRSQPVSFILDRVGQGVFLTIAPSPTESGTNILFYLEYEPDDDGRENYVKCYAVTNNSSKDDLGEGLATLEANVPYEVTAEDNTLSLSRGDTGALLFTCVIPPEMIPTGGQYPEKSFSQEFAACNQVGLGRWTKGENGYAFRGEGSLAARAMNGGNGSSVPSSSQGEDSSQPISSAPVSSRQPENTVSQEPSTSPQEENQGEAAVSGISGAGAGVWGKVWSNPLLWIGIAAVLVLIVVLAILFLHNRRDKGESRRDSRDQFQQETSPAVSPAVPRNPAAVRPADSSAGAPQTASHTSPFLEFADMVEDSHFSPSPELNRRMQQYDQGPSIFSAPQRQEAQTRPVPPAPVPAKPVVSAVSRSAPAPSPDQGIVQQIQALYQGSDSQKRKLFEEQVKTLFLDMDEQTSVNLHYGYQTDYRMTDSSRSYIASDYIVAADQYLLLNYYHYNTQKNNYLLSKSMLEELHVDQVFAITDAAGRALEPAAAMGKSIVQIVPAKVRPDGQGYVLASKGRIQVNG